MKITCNRCTMSFRVESCHPHPYPRRDCCRCPDCCRAFWHSRHPNGRLKIRVGIDPKWLSEWEDAQQEL